MPPSSGSEGSTRKLSPFVFWAQTESNISLRVSLQDVSVNLYKQLSFVCFLIIIVVLSF